MAVNDKLIDLIMVYVILIHAIVVSQKECWFRSGTIIITNDGVK